MDAQTELERALTLIDDLVQNYSGVEKTALLLESQVSDCVAVINVAEDFLRKHKRIP